jgi:predicted dehydrogenase
MTVGTQPVLNVAVVGYGRWGVNHVRVLQSLPQTRVVAVVDSDLDHLAELIAVHPDIAATTRLDVLLKRDDVDAIIIATPAATHGTIAQVCLAAGKHVLCEKPLTTRSIDAAPLIRLAEEAGVVLMTGHTFLFNAAVTRMRELLAGDAMGDLYYLYARRTNLGPIRGDVNALWDLACHDVAIFNYLLDATPTWVSATGHRILGTPREDVGFVALKYPDGIMAHIHVSWADPNKVREIVAVGSEKRIVFNDVGGAEPVRIFDRGVAPRAEAAGYGDLPVTVRDGDIVSPRIDMVEPLRAQALHFVACTHTGEPVTSDGRFGRDVVTVLEAIDMSVAANGAPMSIAWSPKEVEAASHG